MVDTLAPRARWRLARRVLIVAPIVGFLMALTGCAAGPVDYARAYPSDKANDQTLDVQVFRRDDQITLTNTSPVVFGAGTLWINAAYSHPITGLELGQSISLSLHEFRNEYSQPFRAGGFFAVELPWSVVLAEIENDEELFGLVVVEDRTD